MVRVRNVFRGYPPLKGTDGNTVSRSESSGSISGEGDPGHWTPITPRRHRTHINFLGGKDRTFRGTFRKKLRQKKIMTE